MTKFEEALAAYGKACQNFSHRVGRDEDLNLATAAVLAAHAAAVAEERERCAAIAEAHGLTVGEKCWNHDNSSEGASRC